MTSSRSFSTLAALLVVVSLAAVGPAAAVAVDDGDTDVVTEAEVGDQVSATVTLTDLYREPNWDPWTLQGETELRNVTWSVTLIDQQGNEFDTATYDGQQLSGGDGVQISTGNDVAEVRIELVGTVPEPEAYTYPEEETFVVASLTQARGEDGSRNDIDTWEAHHFSTATADGEPGSQEAREAIANARSAIESAKAAGADTTAANRSLSNAIEFYESGQFTNAVENARTARQEAQQAESDVESSQQTTRLLLFGGAGLVVLLLIGGGVWFYRQQQDDYDKLG